MTRPSAGDDHLPTGLVARLLGMSAERVRQLRRHGVLRPAIVDASGRALYLRADVEELARVRAERRAKNGGR